MQKSGFLRALQASLLALSLVAMNLAPITSVLAQTTDTPPPSDTETVETPTLPVVDDEGTEDTGDGTDLVVDDEIDSEDDTDTGDEFGNEILELFAPLFMDLAVEAPNVQVHIYKYVSGPSGEALATGGDSFPMQSTWDAENLGGPGGPASYFLSSPTYNADTAPMTSGADYATHEVTGGDILPIGAACEANKYRLLGYREGTSLSAAESDTISTASPSYTDLTEDMYVIVVNEDCDNPAPPPPPEIPECNLGDDTTFDTFLNGNVNGQFGWSSTGSYDQEVVDNTYGYSTFGCKSLRISNAVTSGSFGDQTFSYSVANEAGETAADSGGQSGGTRQNHFEAQFDLGSTESTVQTDLILSVSPDRGDGARMSYLRFEDRADGIHVFFDDVTDAGPLPTVADFNETDIATLDRTIAHTIKFSMDFVDGPSNDVVEIYIDGFLEITGTTWEDYYRYDPEQTGGGNLVPTTDSLIFRAGGSSVSGNNGNGFLFDNVSLESSTEAPQMCTLVSDDVNTFIGTIPAMETFEHDAWSDELDGDGAEWIWDAEFVADPTQTQTVTFTRSFNVTGTPGTATLEIASDNLHTVDVNGTPVSCGGATQPNYATVGGDNTCVIPVVAGPNTITFTVTNEATPNDSNPENNPAGLYYKISVPQASCSEVPPGATATVTMCKVSDAEGNPGLSDWQLYLKGSSVHDDLSVPSTNSSGVNSNPLVLGMNYLVTAVGTWANQGGANLVDAEYSTTDAWATHMDGYDGYQTDILELQINSEFDPASDWGPYNGIHTYSRIYNAGANGPANFRIFDGSGTTQNEGWFGDNSGSLSVDIDNAYAGTTTEGGCVTLEDVPYGTYTAGEIAQEGWTLTGITGAEGSAVEGTSVVVDSPTESFTFVNHDENEAPAACVIGSDTTTLEGGDASYLVTFVHSSWTAFIDGVSWIWGDAAIVDPEGTETQVFTKSFWLDSAPVTDATLQIAADNSYSVTLNGDPIVSDASEDNYTSAGQDTINVPAASLQAGANTLVITVTNLPMEGGTEETNPAGLKYKLTIDGTDCSETPLAQETLKVHIFKYLSEYGEDTQVADDSGETPFPMVSTWSAANIGAGSGSYVLGNSHGGAAYVYAADTSAMSAPADYTTSEVTDGTVVVPIGGICEADKSRLVGYREGNTLIEAQNDELSDTAPVYTGLTADKYVIVVNEDCDEVLEEGDGSLTIVKNTVGGDGTFQFTVDSENENLDDAMNFSLTTNEGNGHSDSWTSELAPGAYEITEQVPSGWSLDIECVYEEYSAGISTSPQSESVTIAAGENVTCTFTNTLGEEGGDPTPVTIIVTEDTATGENQPGWLFNRDTSTQSPYEFVAGVASIGTGSLFIEPITNTLNGNSDKFIGELFLLTDIADINSITYDFQIDAPDATVEEHFYMSVYANFGVSSDTKFYDCRYSVVPTVGSDGSFTTVTFDPSLTYPVTQHGTSPAVCPASPAAMGADAHIRAISLNVGDTSGSDTGISGYLDKVVVSTDSMITTYDFEPEPEASSEATNNNGGGGGGSRSARSNPPGQVLGASTDGQVLGNSCPLLTLYMREGNANDSSQVSALQSFLNGELSLSLMVSGIFDSLTTNAVNTFQVKYGSEVLAPWIPYGLANANTPTGYVYKTTLWKINDIACPDLDVPFPTLP